MVDDKSIRFLEGLGYTSALMIAAAGFTEVESLRWFNVAGLVFGLIAVVRLLATDLRMRISSLEVAEGRIPGPRPGIDTED